MKFNISKGTRFAVETTAKLICTYTPYERKFVKRARTLGGDWNRELRRWEFPIEQKDAVWALLVESYGDVTPSTLEEANATIAKAERESALQQAEDEQQRLDDRKAAIASARRYFDKAVAEIEADTKNRGEVTAEFILEYARNLRRADLAKLWDQVTRCADTDKRRTLQAASDFAGLYVDDDHMAQLAINILGLDVALQRTWTDAQTEKFMNQIGEWYGQ